MNETRTDRLIAEFTQTIGLEATDAHRSAFVAFAVSKGWSKARIGRYLGISRARVGQKVDKLEHYAHSCPVPTLKALMQASPARSTTDERIVQYEPDDWTDLEFARALIDRVA